MINLAMPSKITFTACAVINERLLTSATGTAQNDILPASKCTFELQGIIP